MHCIIVDLNRMVTAQQTGHRTGHGTFEALLTQPPIITDLETKSSWTLSSGTKRVRTMATTPTIRDIIISTRNMFSLINPCWNKRVEWFEISRAFLLLLWFLLMCHLYSPMLLLFLLYYSVKINFSKVIRSNVLPLYTYLLT